MKILVLGAAGFIGTNLVTKLLEDKENRITLFDRDGTDFSYFEQNYKEQIKVVTGNYCNLSDFKPIVSDSDVVYHLISVGNPSTSNKNILGDIENNIPASSKLFDACVECKVKKVVFLSSGGTVYGNTDIIPIPETAPTNPISTYGFQKLIIEKMLALYGHMYGLNYNIIRLANPYGPHQNPLGNQGIVTIFAYKAIRGEPITVYGKGDTVRDYIFIDDVVKGIIKISDNAKTGIYNLGSGEGKSINDIIKAIEETLNVSIEINHIDTRGVDADKNVLDMTKYNLSLGKDNITTLHDGISKTVEFLKKKYDLR